MGIVDNQDKRGSKKRGSVNNERRLASLSQRREQRGSADWGSVEAAWIAAVVTAATLKGAAVSFSLSRDGGAYGVCVLLDGDREQLWYNQDADVQAELEKLFAWFEAL